MKFLSEFRDPAKARSLARRIAEITIHPWTLMEVCGGQTNTIVRYGLDEILPSSITLIHGPGCPVCVTPVELVDRAVAIASLPGVILCSFGDMLRVPGTGGDLIGAKAKGADVRMVYSPLDALGIAKRNRDRQVVFFAVGFETTAPANGMAVYMARRQGLENFSVLVSHVLVPPAMRAILDSPSCKVEGFLAAGHVATVMGEEEYVELSRRYGVPIVITGFEPLDILQGVYMCIRQLEEGKAEVENQYARSVRSGGNKAAQKIMEEVFVVVDRKWRGIGRIEVSGLGLSDEYAQFDAERRFPVAVLGAAEEERCMSGAVLQGLVRPPQCPSFAESCTPSRPLGATMVSPEGACAIYYRYGRRE